MSTVTPLKILSAKALQLVSGLEPTDELVLKRGSMFYGISTEVLVAKDEETPYQTFYDWTVRLGYGDPLGVSVAPIITTTYSNQPIVLPVVETPRADRDTTVIDSIDVSLADNSITPENAIEFIRRLEVIVGNVDRRSDYIDWASRPIKPSLRPKPELPKVGKEHRLYQPYMVQYAADLKVWDAERRIYEHELALYPERLAEWAAKNTIDNVSRTGAHKEDALSLHVTSRSVDNAALRVNLSVKGTDSDLLAMALLALKDAYFRLGALEEQMNELRRR